MFCPRCFATFCARRLVNWGQNGGEAHETQRTDRIVGAVGGAGRVYGGGVPAGIDSTRIAREAFAELDAAKKG